MAAILTIINDINSDVKESCLYASPALPAGSGPDFCNAVLLMRTSLEPVALLAALHGVEKAFDRERVTRWAPRSLDLDLLAYDQRILPDRATLEHWQNLPLELQKTKAPDMLILPHPRLQDRAFVLKPMMDVMPDWRHPILGKDVAQMLADLPQAEKAGVIALK